VFRFYLAPTKAPEGWRTAMSCVKGVRSDSRFLFLLKVVFWFSFPTGSEG